MKGKQKSLCTDALRIKFHPTKKMDELVAGSAKRGKKKFSVIVFLNFKSNLDRVLWPCQKVLAIECATSFIIILYLFSSTWYVVCVCGCHFSLYCVCLMQLLSLCDINDVLMFSGLLDDAIVPLAVCTGHKHPVLCVSSCSSLGIVVSGAKRKSNLCRIDCFFVFLLLLFFQGDVLHFVQLERVNTKASSAISNITCMPFNSSIQLHNT